MNQPIKRIAAIHDLSSFGRCALTVVIPVLSAMGYQVCPIPTAVLSTHTGGFDDFAFLDLTEFMEKQIQHFNKLNLQFNAVYSGFLGSEKQMDIIKSYFEQFGKGTLKMVDPVMGDDGIPYRTYTKVMCSRMRNLVSVADVITPNVTEAAMLLGEPYPKTMPQVKIEVWLKRLSDMGPQQVVITSVVNENHGMVNAAYDKEKDEIWYVDCKKTKVQFPGTGDIFAGILLGGLLDNMDLHQAMETATAFLAVVLDDADRANTPAREGVPLEKCLYRLIR